MAKPELTPAQIIQANMAGIPADREGLLGEYPKMLFRKGQPDGTHCLADNADGAVSALPIGGHKDIVTRVVEDAEQEILASEEGWHDTIDKALAAKKVAA